jgi:hypothetical protein
MRAITRIKHSELVDAEALDYCGNIAAPVFHRPAALEVGIAVTGAINRDHAKTRNSESVVADEQPALETRTRTSSQVLSRTRRDGGSRIHQGRHAWPA